MAPNPVKERPAVPDNYSLGLDIGVASLGWARLALGADGEPGGLLGAGAHVFEAGTEGDAESGRDEPRNRQRRAARLLRRQAWRRARRKRKLLAALIAHDLLPEGGTPLKRPLDIDAYLKALDARLAAAWLAGKGGGHADHQRLPYLLRAAAASRRVERHELGRALYHLAQRRGFQSNRRADAKKKGDEKPGEVAAAIAELQPRIDAFTPPTLGAYLASLNPDEQRLRGRWTSRQMYRSEFDAVWSCQRGFHALPEAARAEIAGIIFHQRPLKKQKAGRCTLIPGEPRCPVAHRAYQRFRVLQTVNNLRVSPSGGAQRDLTPDERAAVLAALLAAPELTFARARRVLNLQRAVAFNLEEGGEKKIVGHRTDAALRGVFGARWDALPEADRDRVVQEVRSYRCSAGLAKRGRERWGLDAGEARAFGEVRLEEGRAGLSLKAVERLLPRLERGEPYGQARPLEFPGSAASGEPMDLLPPVLDAVKDLRNPGVVRALTEVRKVVNAAVRRHGKPALIRVELARDVKNPRGVRERLSRDNREREAARDAVKERVAREAGIARPSREDVEKVLLADECGWQCPYTGRHFGMTDLLGEHSSYDIEHIWPRSRCLDDGFVNKTLCHREENRGRKRGHTPREAYGGDAARFEDILARVARFKGDWRVREAKLERFKAEEIAEDFSSRHLSDTRYIARVAADYLGLLYGGRVDATGRTRVQVCTGGLTAWLRTGWGLDRLLGESVGKNRADHRHHAVDAVVVALSGPRAVRALARAAEDADRRFKRRAFESIDEPWPGFRRDAGAAVEGIVVSHRQSRKVSGPLHDQTVYSRPFPREDGKPPSHRVRKELHKLTPREVRDGKIVDARALAAIRAKLAELGKPDPTQRDLTKILNVPENAPLVKGHGGSMVRLRRVRVDSGPGATRIGSGAGERRVQTSANHHTVIAAVVDPAGSETSWTDEPVTLLECYRRQAAREPIVRRDTGPGRVFKFSLAPGEYLEMDDPGDATRRGLYRVCSVSAGDMELRLHRDARTADEIKQARARVRVSGDRLRKLRARKVLVTYLGEVRDAGG